MRRSSANDLVCLAGGILLAVVPGVLALRAVPEFHDLMQSFGAELPLVTALVMQFYPALLALPLAVLAAWFLWPDRERRGVVTLGLGAAIMVVVPLLLMLVMYLPILRMGAPV